MTVIARDEWTIWLDEGKPVGIKGGVLVGEKHPEQLEAVEVVRTDAYRRVVEALARLAEGAEGVITAGETDMDAAWVAGVARNALNLAGDMDAA
jgi:hypothetical protein